ncbi:hypothetical protein RIF29_20905 [Crotalaria pallida]|uniref:Uncharacterized protein n=1 Tax=Crotalaria pallida TaxID=3830 RepID=A0AAN9F288_CROPI
MVQGCVVLIDFGFGVPKIKAINGSDLPRPAPRAWANARLAWAHVLHQHQTGAWLTRSAGKLARHTDSWCAAARICSPGRAIPSPGRENCTRIKLVRNWLGQMLAQGELARQKTEMVRLVRATLPWANGGLAWIQDQVDKGILSADKVVDSELHPIVIKEPNAKQNDEEWHTFMTRKKTAQLKKDGNGVINKGDGSVNALPSSNG